MTDQELKTVEDHAGCFFSPDQILIIMGKEESCKNEAAFKRSYQKGRLIKEAAIRKSIIELAIGGSSPAQAAAMLMIENSKLDQISV